MRSLKQPWFKFFIIIVLVLGVFFRFFNIDRKVYWHDEVYTSLRTSGYTWEEVIQQVFDGHIIGVKDLQKFQRLSSEKGLNDTVNALMKNPQHPPLYYLMERFWVQLFGTSVAVTRSLSALISLLVFPSVYWLCLELFRSPLVGWVAIALIAVSPFHVLYAQEAREYSLWTVTILLSSASLLRAMRLETESRGARSCVSAWGIYTLTVVLALYSFLFSVFVIIGHGIYVVIIEGLHWSKTLTADILASLAGLLAFAPWLWVIITNWSRLQDTTVWTIEKMPQPILFKIWGLHLIDIFLDLGFDTKTPFLYIIIEFLLILILTLYALYFLGRNTPKESWLFVLTLIAVTSLALMLPDLIFGGQRSATTRYLVPCFLGIHLAVAHLLATRIFGNNFSQQKIWQAILLVIISGGFVSCTISSQAETWWNKTIGHYNYQIAKIVNQAPHPLLLSNASGLNIGDIISLSYLLESKVRLQLVVDPNIPKIPDDCIDKGYPTCTILLFYPSAPLRKGLEKEYGSQIAPVYNIGNFIRLWQLTKR